MRIECTENPFIHPLGAGLNVKVDVSMIGMGSSIATASSSVPAPVTD